MEVGGEVPEVELRGRVRDEVLHEVDYSDVAVEKFGGEGPDGSDVGGEHLDGGEVFGGEVPDGSDVGGELLDGGEVFGGELFNGGEEFGGEGFGGEGPDGLDFGKEEPGCTSRTPPTSPDTVGT